MITFITGGEGCGKTATAVSLMLKELSGRPLYVSGVDGLTIEHHKCPPISEWTTYVDDPGNVTGRKLCFVFPERAAIIIDEAQRVFPPRHSSQKPPDHVAAFETHRHEGIDWYILTQDPSFVDHHVRKLSKRHIHLRDVGYLGRWWYEWTEVHAADDWKTALVKKRFKLPTDAFDKYKSATIHLKRHRSFPKALAVAVLACIGVGVGLFMSYRSISARIAGDEQPKGTPAAASAPAYTPAVHTRRAEVDPRMAFAPRLPDDPGTAPAYDHLRVVTVAPRIIGGFCRGDVCRCFTQQGTDPAIGQDACRAWIASPPFDPYRVDVDQRAYEPARPRAEAASAPL